jgi:hypothetical protein
MGGPGEDKGFGLACDPAGNLYLTGYFTGTANFNPGPGTFILPSAGGYDVFVCKLDSAGSFIWAKRFGGSSDDVGITCALDAANDLYVVGDFSGTADFDPEAGSYNLTSFGGRDIFIEKFLSVSNATTVGSGWFSGPSAQLLGQNYPNPFNASTLIWYTIPGGGGSRNYEEGRKTTLIVYDILGREVQTLVNETKQPGRYQATFNATNLASGVYLYRLQAESFVETRKLCLIR